MKVGALLRGLLLIATLVAIGYLLEFGNILDVAWVDTHIKGRGIGGELLFVAAGMVFTAVGLPRQAISFLGGYAFGLTTGVLLGLCASILGCVLAFYYSRWIGRGFVQVRFARRIDRLDGFIRDNPFTMTLLLRLLPAGSNLVINLLAGVSSVAALAFFAGSALGYLPQTVVFALIGSGINLDPVLRIGVGVALFVVSGVLGVYLYRRYRHGRTFDEAFDGQTS